MTLWLWGCVHPSSRVSMKSKHSLANKTRLLPRSLLLSLLYRTLLRLKRWQQTLHLP